MGVAAALLGARLRERRVELGLKQADLAERAGISASYLNLIEHNRRNVTPEVLARLSQALGLDPQAFSARALGGMSEDLRAAAAALPEARAEVERSEDFAARFPGWAGLVVGLQRRNGALERAVAALNDRLGHDPHLSAALHELLSALSGVRATAGILAETDDLSPDWQRRFHLNLHQDSERLASGAEALVAYLDRAASDEEGITAPQDEFEAWLGQRGWHLAEMEAGAGADLAAEIARLPAAARALAQAHLDQLAQEVRDLPLAPFSAALAEIGPDPALLAARFGTSVINVMRRIAFLPNAEAGLVLCDASGTLLFRKPTAGFTLPRFGAACPLWPLFGALARPGQAVSAAVETLSTSLARFRALAYCETRLPFGFAGPETRIAAMLLLPLRDSTAAALPLGSTCRICPRERCAARREASILGPST